MPDGPYKARIFVVDDERLISSTLAIILRMNGFDALPFTEPLEALRAARREAPDALISDVAMPMLSGVQLAIQMHESCPRCKVLLLSGNWLTDELAETTHSAGLSFEMLLKPAHPETVLREVRKLVGAQPPAATANAA
jgi:DNA-binding NtrC family response regulator